ncbi:MAG TPA: YcxB family protein [Rhizomicrobium sp.]|jgi:hypothetical protein|nr:YcxB family protein [Rhizomicrobium sp.]
MESEIIRGSTVITLSDQIRASWSARSKFVLGVLMLVISAVIMFDVPREAPTIEYVAVTAITAAGTVLLFAAVLLLVRVILVLIFRLRLGADRRDMAYEVSSDSILVRDRTGSSVTTPWSVVRRVKESRNAFRISVKPMGMRYIPKRAFSAGDLVSLRKLMVEKLSSAAKLRVV